jgi:hypothetical protein
MNSIDERHDRRSRRPANNGRRRYSRGNSRRFIVEQLYQDFRDLIDRMAESHSFRHQVFRRHVDLERTMAPERVNGPA